MKQLIHLLFFASSFAAIGQANLVFFTEDEEQFTLYVNGRQINEEPALRVKATGVSSDYARIKISFKSMGLPDVNRGMEVMHGQEMISQIISNNKGRYTIKAVGIGPISDESMEEVVSVTNTAEQTNEVSTTNSVGMNVDLNVGGQSTSVNIQVNETINYSTQISSTSDTDIQESLPVHGEEGCYSPMYSYDFNRSKESIKAKTFADEKMVVFKQIIRSNCLSVNQVTQFMDLFTYEEEKLKVAKLAYSKTVDKNNYYQVNDALTYEDSVEELEDFLNKQ